MQMQEHLSLNILQVSSCLFKKTVEKVGRRVSDRDREWVQEMTSGWT